MNDRTSPGRGPLLPCGQTNMRMKKRLLAGINILLWLILISTSAHAQKRIVTGKVTDSKDGSPLQGATVIPKGAVSGVVTGKDGSFHLSIDQNVTSLVISSVGFSIQEVPVGNGPILVGLKASAAGLNEVIVIGYGTARKKDLTGSIATISEKDFQTGNITTPEQMVAGKVPGVSIIANSGQPGAGSTIRIRGGASLNASNDPLVVIDGVPLENDLLPGQTSVIPGAGSPLSFINPNDIESFTVLKDASAAAIYGSRAANGVIIITTKKGKGGDLKVSLSSVNSASALIKQVPVLTAAQFRTVVDATGTSAQIASMGGVSTNWQDQIYQVGLGSNNNISISGGLKKLPYRISIGYQDQNGILKTDNLRKTSAALVFNPVLFDNHLKVNLNLKGSLENTRFANTGAIGAAVTFDPTQSIYTKSNRFGSYFEYLDPTSATGLLNNVTRNPLGQLEQQYGKATPERSIGNLQLDYKFHFLPDLHANLNLGYDISNGKGYTFITDSAASAYAAGGVGGEHNPYKQTKQNTVLEFYLSYTKDLRKIRSHFDILGGYSYNDYLATLYNYPTYNGNGVEIVNSAPPTPYTKQQHILISYFGRANYSYDDRYLLTGTLRYDGSSRFAPSNRWGLFPSAAFAWKVKNEAFLRNSTVLSDLKVRLGYGVTGQQDGIGNYDYLAYYYLSSANAAYEFGDSYYQAYRPAGFDPNRQWEQTASSNIALDFGFLDNRITGSIDFYNKKTTKLLNTIPVAAGSNFSAYITENVGSMTNKGIEFNLNAEPIRSRDLTWDLGFNITYNKNRITQLTVNPGDTSYPGFQSGAIAGGIGGQYAEINAVGGPKNTFYLYRQVYDSYGKPIEGVFVDKNGDGIINQNDLFKSKQADPDLFFGFSTNVTYKRWNAGFVLRASLHNYVYNNFMAENGNLTAIEGSAVLYNASSNYLVTRFKGGNAQTLLSDYYMQNASFLRMDNVNIGYNLGKIPHTRTNFRVSATVQNVFVITKYQGLDPEIAANGNPGNPGIDNSLYPKPRTYSLALNLDF